MYRKDAVLIIQHAAIHSTEYYLKYICCMYSGLQVIWQSGLTLRGKEITL
jgi:hypothetical protein